MTTASQPLAVCMFTNSEVRGGAENHMLDLLARLDPRRFSLSLACPEALLALIARDLPTDVETFAVSLAKPTQLGAMFALAGFLRRRRTQIAHSHGFFSSLFGSPVAKCAGVPVTIETPHLREYWRRGWKANYAVDRFVGRFVDGYIGVSYANARYLREEKRLPAGKIIAIQNGSDLRRFDPARQAPAGLRAQLGFGETDPIMLLAGRLEPQKGHRVLLEAMPAVLAAVPQARLLCLGDGALRAELEAQARRLDLTDAVRFLGHRSDVEDWLALADFCVLPSFFEGLPLAAIESLASGRTMVATAVDGTPEIIVNEETGLTVPPGDPQALAAALIRMLCDPELRARFSRAGRCWVEERFDIALQVSSTERFYEQLWERRTGLRLAAPEPAATAAPPRISPLSAPAKEVHAGGRSAS